MFAILVALMASIKADIIATLHGDREISRATLVAGIASIIALLSLAIGVTGAT